MRSLDFNKKKVLLWLHKGEGVIMKMKKLWLFLVLSLFSEFLIAKSVRFKDINVESEFSLLLQNLRERGGAREPISKQDIELSLQRLTGEILGEIKEEFISQANQDILFEIVMSKMPEIVSALHGRRDITPNDILKKFNEIAQQSLELNNQELENLLLNFNAQDVREEKGRHAVAVLTGRQLFMITKDLVNNKMQNITEVVIKDRARVIFNIDLVLPKSNSLVDQVKKMYGEICMMYGLLRVDMLMQILQKTLKSDISYVDIEVAYYDMFGVKLKYLDESLKGWFVSVVADKYSKFLQNSLNDEEIQKIAGSFLEGEVVDYEDIQRQFLKQTKEKYLGRLLSLSSQEQKRIVDLINQELKHKGVAEDQLTTLMNFLDKYSCQDVVVSDMANSTKYVMKSGIDRIINAQRAKKCIEQNGWKLLSIADKCLVCKKRNCSVVATRVDAQSVSVFSLAEVKELVAFTEATGYQDWGVLVKDGYSANVLRDMSSGNLVFIDTEDKSFEVFFADTKYDCVELFWSSMKHLMTSDTSKWVEDRLKYLKDHDEEIVVLPKNSTYDPVDMSFSKVKEEAVKIV